MSLGIRAKLMAGFGAVLFLMAIVGAVGYRDAVQFSSQFKSLYDDRFLPAVDLSHTQLAL